MVDRLGFIDKIFARAKVIMVKKNHDYANDTDVFSNLQECVKAGIPAWKGVLIRCSDKYSREMEFARKETLKVSDESFANTILDHINYLAIALTMYEKEKEKEYGNTERTDAGTPEPDRGSGKRDVGGWRDTEGAISTVISHKEAAKRYDEAQESIQPEAEV